MSLQTEKPTLFIGSSTEGLEVARAIRDSLADDATVTVWEDAEEFELGKSTLDAVIKASSAYDFAVLVFSPDDEATVRGADWLAPRDNVLFELGLFMGTIGRERTFFVVEKRSDLKIPSDFAGITAAEYERRSSNLKSDLGAAVNRIRARIEERGPRTNESHLTSTEIGVLYRILNAVKSEAYDDVDVQSYKSFLTRIRNPEHIGSMAEVVEFVQDLFSDYVHPRIPPRDLWAKSIRIYFAYYLGDGVYPDRVGNPTSVCWCRDDTGVSFAGSFVVGVSNTDKFPEKDWREGMAIPGYEGMRALSNCAKVFASGAESLIPDTTRVGGSAVNHPVQDERCVYTFPVEWRSSEGRASVGVVGMSSSEPRGITAEVEGRARNLAIFLGAIFSHLAPRLAGPAMDPPPPMASLPTGVRPGSAPEFAHRVRKLRRQIARHFEDDFIARGIHVLDGERLVVAGSVMRAAGSPPTPP